MVAQRGQRHRVGGVGHDDQRRRLATGRELAVCRGHTGEVTGVSFSRDGKRLASAGKDGAVKIWDPTTGLEILTVGKDPNSKAPADAPSGVQFSPAKDDWQLATFRGPEVRLYGPPRGSP